MSVSSFHQELIDFHRQLVRLPSLSGQEGAVADAVYAKMTSLDFDKVWRDPLGNVIALKRGEFPGLTLLFDAHLDVAPVGELERWQHEPFGGELVDGRVWGRGSADTKASLAAMLAGLSSLPSTSLSGRVVLAATVQEETLTSAAVFCILKQFTPDVFVTGEPTSLELAVAQKGRVTLELQSHGRSAHTSQPEAGENAVDKMIEAIQRLRQMPMHIDPDLGREFLELTEIISAPYPNSSVVPFGCTARLIGRILPEETRPGFMARVGEALSDLAGIEASIAHLNGCCYTGESLEMDDFLPGWRNPPEDIWGKRILTALAAEGLPAKSFASGCGTNASATGGLALPAFIYGPGSLKQAHTVDEWIAVDDIRRAVRGYRAIAAACLSK